MSSDTFKVWITRYALTEGIYEKEAKVCINVSEDMIEVIGSNGMYFHGEGKDWHRTKESAIKRAEEMRKKKITSVEKQLQRLKDMKFE